jgi:hypothetical protein
MDNSSYKSFSIQAFEIIINDACVDAETLTVSSTIQAVNFGIAGAAINNEVGCDGNPADDYADVWYDFTMPYDGTVSIDGSISWNNFALYDSCGGTQLDCFSDTGVFMGLTNGTTYKLSVFRTSANATNTSYKSFTIQTTETLSAEQNILSEVKIYPNPAKSTLFIDSNHQLETIKLYDFNGRKLFDTPFQSNLDVSNLSSGMYFITIEANNRLITKKLTIQ